MAILKGSALADLLLGDRFANIIEALGGNDIIKSYDGDDTISAGGGDDVVKAGAGADTVTGEAGNDDLNGGGGNDTLDGGSGADILSGSDGDDLLMGGGGADKMSGGRDADTLYGGTGNDILNGNGGDDVLNGDDGQDRLFGDAGDDVLEGGAGDDALFGGAGDDILYGFSWAGEPVPAQDAGALVNTDEPVSDTDTLQGGAGADQFEFRWLIDGRDEIIARNTDATGNIDYSMNGVAGENDNVHDHWVESIGVKVVTDFNADEGDTLVFAGHTVQLDQLTLTDYDGNGTLDSVLEFVSNQGGNGGAHDGDKVGTVVVLGTELDAADIAVDAGVFYGVEEPFSVLG